jgi:hypothetical protein
MTINPRRIKLLSTTELLEIKNKYNIKMIEDNLVVALNTRNQTTIHKLNKTLNLRVSDRKFTITTRAISLWQENLKYLNIFDIQHAINLLTVSKKDITEKNIKDVLNVKNDFS